MGFKFCRKYFGEFSSVTLDSTPSDEQVQELLNALNIFHDIGIIFTLPNADTDGRKIINLIHRFCKNTDIVKLMHLLDN